MKVADFALETPGVAFGQPGEREAQTWPGRVADWFLRDHTARVIVSRELNVQAVNSRALEMMAAGDVLSIYGGQLRAKGDVTLAKLREAVTRACQQESVELLGPADSGVLLTAGAASDGPEESVTLTLRDVSVPVEFNCTDLCQAFGLTAGEQSMILGLLRGQCPREIAEETGRSILTVRSHLKRAYLKIGVQSRTQLFARLLPYASVCSSRRGRGNGATAPARLGSA